MRFFGIGRRRVEQPAPQAFVEVPPRGGVVVAEVHEGQVAVLASALIGGGVLEVGRVRAARVAGGRFLVQTRHGVVLVHDAMEAVKRLLIEDEVDQVSFAA